MGRPAAWRRNRRGNKHHFMGICKQTIEEYPNKADRDERFIKLWKQGLAVTRYSTIEGNKTLWCVVF